MTMAVEFEEIGLENDTVHLHVIERPSQATIQEAVDIFCVAFENDPPSRTFTGGNPALMHDLAHAVLSPLGGGVAHLYAATDADGALVGASFWTLPGKPDQNTEQERKTLMDKYLTNVSEEVATHVRSVFGKDIPRLAEEAVGVAEAEVACYDCEMLMVRPDHHGRGIARAMFELAKHKADAMHAKMMLWTGNDRNVKMYEKLGMTLKSSTPLSTPGEDWTLHVLTREPVTGSPK